MSFLPVCQVWSAQLLGGAGKTTPIKFMGAYRTRHARGLLNPKAAGVEITKASWIVCHVELGKSGITDKGSTVENRFTVVKGDDELTYRRTFRRVGADHNGYESWQTTFDMEIWAPEALLSWEIKAADDWPKNVMWYGRLRLAMVCREKPDYYRKLATAADDYTEDPPAPWLIERAPDVVNLT